MIKSENILNLAQKLTEATERDKEFIKGYMSGVLAERAKVKAEELKRKLSKGSEHKKTA